MPLRALPPIKSWQRFLKELALRPDSPAGRLSCLVYSLALEYLKVHGLAGLYGEEPLETAKRLHHSLCLFAGESFAISLEEPQSADRQLLESLRDRLGKGDLASLFETTAILGDSLEILQQNERRESLKKIQRADKNLGLSELVAFTRIYTPSFVVEFLTDRTLANRDPLSVSVLDPACGSGHFLVAALDAILNRTDPRRIEKNLTGLLAERIAGADIDADALSITALCLLLHANRRGLAIEDGIRAGALQLVDLESTAMLGSLHRGFPDRCPLGRKYDVVLTNPPYIGRKLMSRSLKARLKEKFAGAHSDLSAAFIYRCLDFLSEGGSLAAITQASIISLPTYGKLRRHLLTDYSLESVVDAGPGLFPLRSGEKINSALLIIKRETGEARKPVEFIDIRDAGDRPAALARAASGREPQRVFMVSRKNLDSLDTKGFAYRLPAEMLEFAGSAARLDDIFEIRQGLATTDNSRFVRNIWEVDPGELNRIWFPYAKGTGQDRWYSPVLHVVDWQNHGERIKESVATRYPYLGGKVNWVVKNESFYFRKGLCFSFVNSRGIAVRKLPPGCIFDVSASAIFYRGKDDDENQEDYLIGYLNSSIIMALLRSLNPTINYQVGDLRRLPVVEGDREQRLTVAESARACVEARKELVSLTVPESHFLKEPVSENTAYACFAESARQRRMRLEGSIEKLRLNEKRIDETVLAIIEKSRSWSSAGASRVESWLAAGESRKSQEFPEPEEFLAGILLADLVGGAAFRREKGRRYRLALAKKGSGMGAPFLELDQGDCSYIRELTGKSPEAFINGTLKRRTDRIFKKSFELSIEEETR
ncbi:MAG: N-6 DNA methylase [Candidatus Melainabacteria bacterium]|nr:N-6 DNA methylase [Candidatus Melainabacteria bacterium]